MKHQKNTIKILALAIAIIQIFLLTEISVTAINNNIEDIPCVNNTVACNDNPNTNSVYNYNSNNYTDLDLPDLTFAVNDIINTATPSVRITFDATNIVDYSFNTDGITAIESQSTPMEFDLIAGEEFGTFNITAEKTDGTITSKTLYTYNNDSKVYVSDVGKDSAWHDCKQEEIDSGIITLDSWHNQYSAFSLMFTEPETDYCFENISEINTAIYEGKNVVRGRMTWQTASGTVLPMKFTKVELRYWSLATTICVSTTYTDADGYYYFIFDPEIWNLLSIAGIGMFVRTYTESSTFTVIQPFMEQFNYYDSNLVLNSNTETGVVNISRRVVENIDCLMYKSVYVQQGMIAGQRLALEMGMETNTKLYVFYPFKVPYVFSDNGASCYDFISFIGLNQYSNFKGLVHEYGHYVENRMNTYGDALKGHIFDSMPSNFNGTFEQLSNIISDIYTNFLDYKHDLGENHFENNASKDFQMELTWAESWATVFSEIVFYHYRSEYIEIYSSLAPQYEKYSYSGKGGEAQEAAVICFLWDLYDSYSSEEQNDNISISLQQWWNITTKSGTYKLQDLSNTIISYYPELINDVGEIFNKHEIAPSTFSFINSPCTYGQLRLFWMPNGSDLYPNNIFRVAFYDNENNLIALSDEINSTLAYSDIFSYDVPIDLWKSVMEHYEEGKIIYAVVYGYRSGEFTSGPYFSTYINVWDDSKNHNFNSIDYDISKHWSVCNCGVVNENRNDHNFTYTNINQTSGTHLKTCSECAYAVYEEHQHSEFVEITDSHHSTACVCGQVGEPEEHYIHHYSRNNSLTHYVYCECGESNLSAHVVSSGSGGILTKKICIFCGEIVDKGLSIITSLQLAHTENGSYIRPDGIIVLVDEDIEAYLNGELVFYNSSDNLETE